MKKEKNVLIIFGDIEITDDRYIVRSIDNIMFVPKNIAYSVADNIMKERLDYDNYIIPQIHDELIEFRPIEIDEE